jgi:hypothetical protein
MAMAVLSPCRVTVHDIGCSHAGSNDAGELGDGSYTDSEVPVAVSGGGTWSAVSASWHHTCGVKTGGALFCWGALASGWFNVCITPRTLTLT